jgi:hypothetical protein
MNLNELMRRYAQLRQELSASYDARPWPSQRIDDLAEKLSDTEREIAALHVNAVPWSPEPGPLPAPS